jgi:cytochrome c oxidase cbb3-type subunit III
MLSTHNGLRLLLGLSLFLWTGVFHISIARAQQRLSSDVDSKATAAAGKSTFDSTCAGCHGLDGRGSDKAVNISSSSKVRHLSDSQVASIISNGVPGTGMPAFHNLAERQIRAVVGYLRSLQGKQEARTLPGDAMRGKAIFFGKGECSTCHMISGEGGFFGPDLSVYGSSLPAQTISEEIIKPQRIAREGYRSAVLTTAAGDRLEGMIRNEDNFSVQFQTRDGSFHFFQKSELRNLEHLDTSLMPTNYRDRLSPVELNDLVSYLMNVAPDTSKGRTSHKKEDHAE